MIGVSWRKHLRSTRRWLDGTGLVVLTASIVYVEWDVIAGSTLAGMDTATAFYPWYAFLGRSLRAGSIPVWNPHQFSGTPFAADPESGWMYLPAMLLFSLFTLPFAAKSFILLHVLLAGWFTYALARALGANAAGATLAGATYALSGFLYGHSVCCFAYASVAVWLPLVLLAAERAIRSSECLDSTADTLHPHPERDAWLQRCAWWAIGGFGLSQIVAAWVGQGAYYAFLVWAAYLASRTLLRRASPTATLPDRCVQLLSHASATLLFGACLAAAGLLPRLEYNAVSNVPGGYPDPVTHVLPALTNWGFIRDWNVILFTPGFYYLGVPPALLALAAPLVAARRTGVALCALLALAVLVLSRLEPTPLHWLLSFLPGYERLTQRSPERALIVLYLPCSLLAGTTLTWLSQLKRFQPASHVLGWVLVVGIVQLDLYPASRSLLDQALHGNAAYELQRLDLTAYYAPPPALQFLQSRAPGDLFRYFGYAEHFSGVPIPYTLRWAEPRTAALGVNNLALIAGLDDIQGYNPVHVARYDEFMAALNGQGQNYHHTDILETGLNSPLIDLLNVRYVIVPTVTASDEVPPRLERKFPVAYSDTSVTIFENPSALPRIRLVHSAQQVAAGHALQALLSSPDPRTTTVLEAPLPELGQPTTPEADLVEPSTYRADDINVQTRSSTAGLLVMSEVYYPAWKAYVDGQPTMLYVANHAFRAVAVPAGSHSIELRYESVPLQVGGVVSLGAYAGLVGLLVASGLRTRRRMAARRGPRARHAGAEPPRETGTESRPLVHTP